MVKELILKSKLKNKSKRPTRFVPWDKAKTVALFVDVNTASNKSLIDKFIYESDKLVDVYYLDLKVKDSVVKNFITFTKAHKNAFGIPNSKAMQKLSKNYDILINAAFQESEFATVLSNGLAAQCKVSFQNRSQVFNLIIDRREQQDLFAYLKDVVNYLKMIRN